jgi:hypothetical protein
MRCGNTPFFVSFTENCLCNQHIQSSKWQRSSGLLSTLDSMSIKKTFIAQVASTEGMCTGLLGSRRVIKSGMRILAFVHIIFHDVKKVWAGFLCIILFV